MSNLTIAMDDQLIKQARVRAIQEGTSLSAKVREFVQRYVNGSDTVQLQQRQTATAQLLAAMDAAMAQTGAQTGANTDRAAAASGSQSASPQTRNQTATQIQTLRDSLYEGDYRARDRGVEPSTASTPAIPVSSALLASPV
jgi:plasmid stability protein